MINDFIFCNEQDCSKVSRRHPAFWRNSSEWMSASFEYHKFISFEACLI